MIFSLQLIVGVVALLLALASAVSFYFAIGREYAIPLLLVAVVNLEAVVILIFLITRGIIYPLKKIRSIMEKIGEGDLQARIELLPTREMQELGETLNEMIKQLRIGKEEMQARTQELNEKVSEFKRFQKLAIGRELKMVELKEAVQKLQEEMSQSKRSNMHNK